MSNVLTGRHECFHIIIVVVNSEGSDIVPVPNPEGEVGRSIFSSVIPRFFSLLVYTSVHVGYPVCVFSLSVL
jgi:hypothetical protein